MELTQIFGVAGAITYLASYFLLQLRFITGTSFVYAFMNMAAAGMVLISLITHFNIGSLIIQVSFITLSLIGILTELAHRRPVKVSAEEGRLMDYLFPGVPHRRALTLLKKGAWVNGRKEQLTTEGQENDALVYLAKGRAKVIKDGQEICDIRPGNLIGDFSCLSGKAANADVCLSSAARYFRLPTAELRRALEKDIVLKGAFESRLAEQAQSKLENVNRLLSAA